MADPLLRAMKELSGFFDTFADDRDDWRSLSTYDDPDVSRVGDENEGEGDDDGDE
jgi:hypothetical protein